MSIPVFTPGDRSVDRILAIRYRLLKALTRSLAADYPHTYSLIAATVELLGDLAQSGDEP